MHSVTPPCQWRSFQLGPDTRTDPSRNAVRNLAEKQGWTLEFTRQAVAQVSNQAKAVGLAFNYEQTKVANTFEMIATLRVTGSNRIRASPRSSWRITCSTFTSNATSRSP